MKPILIVSGSRSAKIEFYPGLGRVDFTVDAAMLDGTNIANDDFPAEGTMEERLERWGRDKFKNFRKCDICQTEGAYAPPLHDYDLEEFPDLKGKTVCSACRSKRYGDLISGMLKEEKAELMSGFVGKKKVIEVVDMNLCMIPECNCGWNVSVHILNEKAMKRHRLGEKCRLKVRGDGVVTIGGTSDQWPALAKICKLAGGRLPSGYPPR